MDSTVYQLFTPVFFTLSPLLNPLISNIISHQFSSTPPEVSLIYFLNNLVFNLKLHYLYRTFSANRIRAGHHLFKSKELHHFPKIEQMLAEFTFLRHPVLKVLRFGNILVPNVERIDAFYYDEYDKTLHARTLTNSMDYPFGKMMELNGHKQGLDKLRRSKARFKWVERAELPWTPAKDENINRDLLTKLDNLVLIIEVESQEKGNFKDLIIFYFNNDLSNLLITTNDKVTRGELDFVGSVYYLSVTAMIKAAQIDRDVWEDFAPTFKNNEQTIENLRMEFKTMRKNYQEILIASCEHFLQKLSLEYGVQYKFSEGAKEQLKKYEGESFKLENAIKSGVRIANNFQVHDQSDIVEIRESHLNFNTSRRIAEIHDIHIQTDLEKPFNYLNQLEAIAQDLRKNNRPITGKNVAENMNPVVQAPAITMYLNSNQKKVLKLFGFYAEKWKLLRTDFKPTFNILENAKNRPGKRS